MRKLDKVHARKDPWYNVLKRVVRKKLRCAYYQYVEDNFIISPSNNDNPLEANKHFFILLKHPKSNNTGVHLLKNNGTLISDPKGKASLLNVYFQSEFTIESLLSLKKHCHNSPCGSENLHQIYSNPPHTQWLEESPNQSSLQKGGWR